jgi:hypothetical protein
MSPPANATIVPEVGPTEFAMTSLSSATTREEGRRGDEDGADRGRPDQDLPPLPAVDEHPGERARQ